MEKKDSEEVPNGTFNDADKRDLQFQIKAENGKVFIDFGTPIDWIEGSPENIRAIAAVFLEYAEKAENDERKTGTIS